MREPPIHHFDADADAVLQKLRDANEYDDYQSLLRLLDICAAKSVPEATTNLLHHFRNLGWTPPLKLQDWREP